MPRRKNKQPPLQPHNWANDPRPFHNKFREWCVVMNDGQVWGAKPRAAERLHISVETVGTWYYNKTPSVMGMVLYLMQKEYDEKRLSMQAE